MSQFERISPTQAFAAMSENNALLVATYETGFKFEMSEIPGAIPSDKYHKIQGGLPMNQELIFY